MPITTLANVKEFIGKSDASSDAVLTGIIDAATVALGNFCNRNFEEHDFVEHRDGNEAATMTLANFPLVSVASVVVDGQSKAFAFPPAGRRIILQNGARFAEGNRNVVITGRAGYGGSIAYPKDLTFAANQWVAARYNERARLGIGSKSLAGESITFAQADPAVGALSTGIPAAAKTILQNYANQIPETGL